MSYLNMFRRKPAITRSDWYFAAFKDSSENYATFTRSIHYNLVLERSPGFGSNRSNLPIIFFDPVAFAKVFNLATPINLLHLYQYFHIGLDYTFNSIKMAGKFLIFKIVINLP